MKGSARARRAARLPLRGKSGTQGYDETFELDGKAVIDAEVQRCTIHVSTGL